MRRQDVCRYPGQGCDEERRTRVTEVGGTMVGAWRCQDHRGELGGVATACRQKQLSGTCLLASYLLAFLGSGLCADVPT